MGSPERVALYVIVSSAAASAYGCASLKREVAHKVGDNDCGPNRHDHEANPQYDADRDTGLCAWAALPGASSSSPLPTIGSEKLVVLKGLVVLNGSRTQGVDVRHFTPRCGQEHRFLSV